MSLHHLITLWLFINVKVYNKPFTLCNNLYFYVCLCCLLCLIVVICYVYLFTLTSVFFLFLHIEVKEFSFCCALPIIWFNDNKLWLWAYLFEQKCIIVLCMSYQNSDFIGTIMLTCCKTCNWSKPCVTLISSPVGQQKTIIFLITSLLLTLSIIINVLILFFLNIILHLNKINLPSHGSVFSQLFLSCERMACWCCELSSHGSSVIMVWVAHRWWFMLLPMGAYSKRIPVYFFVFVLFFVYLL